MVSPKKEAKNASTPDELPLVRRHLVIGWWSLLLFLGLGIFLEALHGLKLGLYLSVEAETRRLMWTLAHTHGTLLSLVHIVFATTIGKVPEDARRSLHLASLCLIGAGVLMPAGFFLGGVFFYSGDPGLGIFLVPPGGILLLVAVLTMALVVTRGTMK